MPYESVGLADRLRQLPQQFMRRFKNTVEVCGVCLLSSPVTALENYSIDHPGYCTTVSNTPFRFDCFDADCNNSQRRARDYAAWTLFHH